MLILFQVNTYFYSQFCAISLKNVSRIVYTLGLINLDPHLG